MLQFIRITVESFDNTIDKFKASVINISRDIDDMKRSAELSDEESSFYVKKNIVSYNRK